MALFLLDYGVVARYHHQNIILSLLVTALTPLSIRDGGSEAERPRMNGDKITCSKDIIKALTSLSMRDVRT